MNHEQGCEHTAVNKIWHVLCKSHAFFTCAALIEQDLPGELTGREHIPNGNIACRISHLIVSPSSSIEIASCCPFIQLILAFPIYYHNCMINRDSGGARNGHLGLQ